MKCNQFQPSCKYAPSPNINPIPIIFNTHSIVKMIVKGNSVDSIISFLIDFLSKPLSGSNPI